MFNTIKIDEQSVNKMKWINLINKGIFTNKEKCTKCNKTLEKYNHILNCQLKKDEQFQRNLENQISKGKKTNTQP